MTPIQRCGGCPWLGSNEAAIGSSGPIRASVVFVGEAPGRQELDAGQPFVGRAGTLLREIVMDAGIDISAVLIVNALACRPPKVRPTVAAITACRSRLHQQLGLSSRTVVVALGGTALRAVTDRSDLRISDVRGKVLGSKWGTLVPTWHPARILRRPAERPQLLDDLCLAAEFVTGRTPVRPQELRVPGMP
jgi:DNA polymerase